MKNKIIILLLSTLVISGCNSSDVENYIKDKIKYDNGVVDDSGTPDDTPVGDITSQEIQDALDAHNSVRADVGINQELSWDENLKNAAQLYADKMAESGIWEHDYDGNKKNGYGENLYTSTQNVILKDAVKAWADEKQYYHYEDNSCDSGQMCGHYTQIVWKSTSRVGCAKSKYKTGQYKDWFIVVCKYQTPGNYVGQKPY